MKSYAIATIPGDGIGKEVVPAGAEALQCWPKPAGTFALDFKTSAGAATGTARTA